MKWWVKVAIIGIFGIANGFLEALRREVARERQQWEADYNRLEALVLQYQRDISQERRKSKKATDIARLTVLHRSSRQLADQTYQTLEGARRTLDAMGNTIVQIAQSRKELELRKRSAPFHQKPELEKEIMSLHKLRDEILIPDKDKVKAQRDHLSAQLRMLNMETGHLRDEIDALRGQKRR